MIRVPLRNILKLGLPIDNTSKIHPRGSSKKILKELEKKYKQKSHLICYYGDELYVKNEYRYIPECDKAKWLVNYEVYVRSSFAYKFWIWFCSMDDK